MKKLLNPLWIFWLGVLPIVLLLLVFLWEWYTVRPFLEKETTALWIKFSVGIATIGLIEALYALFLRWDKKQVEGIFMVFLFIANLVYLYNFYSYGDDLVGYNVPGYLSSGNLLMYAGAFLMPMIFYSFLVWVVILTPEDKKNNLWVNLVFMIVTPVFFYLFVVFILFGYGYYAEMFSIVLFVVSLIVFFFFTLRFLYILFIQKGLYKKYELFINLPFILIFPIAGLLLSGELDIFGNYNQPVFYFLVVVTAVLLSLPRSDRFYYRLAVFTGLCITYGYTIYFAVVFLPLFPLGLVLLLGVGLGLLIISPVCLLYIHTSRLIRDFNYLRQRIQPVFLVCIILVSLTVLPVGITISYKMHRENLLSTLDYLYSPDYSSTFHPDVKSISKTLKMLEHNRSSEFYSTVPFLSTYYRKLVLDNMSISNTKKKDLKDLANGKYAYRMDPWAAERAKGRDEIYITNIEHTSSYNAQRGVWTSLVDLAITNTLDSRWNTEFITYFELPAGCWISDYYLDVNGVREPGILAERKTATWLYGQIRDRHRDPGLLNYLAGNTIEFKVFPFEGNEIRFTGIEFTHLDPVEIELDGHTIRLGEKDFIRPDYIDYTTERVKYIAPAELEQLPLIEAKPYLHIIVDASVNTFDYEKSEFVEQIRELLKKNLTDPADNKLTLAGAYAETFTMGNDWEKKILSLKPEGGFFLQRAIEKAVIDAYHAGDNRYPHIIVLSGNLSKAIIHGFEDLRLLMPAMDEFYYLHDNTITPYFWSGPFEEDKLNPFPVDRVDMEEVMLRVWTNSQGENFYLPDDNKGHVILSTRAKAPAVILPDTEVLTWRNALNMQGQWMTQILYPEMANPDWLTLLQNSFQTRLLTPLTSYIVVETEQQRSILRQKQEEVMSGHKHFDISREFVPMSEPDLYIWVGLLILFLGVSHYRRISRRRNETEL